MNEQEDTWEYRIENVYDQESSPADWILERELKRRWLAKIVLGDAPR